MLGFSGRGLVGGGEARRWGRRIAGASGCFQEGQTRRWEGVGVKGRLKRREEDPCKVR